MTFFFSANQISGFESDSTKFTLNNPLSLVATRIDDQNDNLFDVIIYGISEGAEANSQIILTNSQAAETQSIKPTDIEPGGDWESTEGRSIPTSGTTQAGDLGKVSTPDFSSIFNTGDFKLKIRENGATIEQEAINYETSANGLIATFSNGVRIQLSSPNTVIQIPAYDLGLLWANGEWAQDLKYSQTNYLKSSDTLLNAEPSSFPSGDSVNINAPIVDGDQIKVAYQFSNADPTFGIASANPLIKFDNDTNTFVPKARSEWSNSYFPSVEELKAQGFGDSLAGYPWYGAVIPDPTDPDSISLQNSSPYFYLNGQFGVDRTNEFDVNLINGTLNNLDPYERFPDVVGVNGKAFGNFQFVVTLKVPNDTVFRPKGGGYIPSDPSYTDFQKSDNTQSGALEKFSLTADGTYEFNIPDGQNIDFYNPDIGEGMRQTVDGAGNSLSFSEWYKNWWDTNTVNKVFPWTGHGYTYDPYYPTDDGWDENPALGPGVGELVQSWRPDGADTAGWMYDILDVETIPVSLGAESTATAGEWQLNVKRLGYNDATIHIYEADSVTGLVAPASDRAKDGSTPPSANYYYPSNDEYVKQAMSVAVQTIDASELPSWGSEKNYNLGALSTGKNYGFVIEVNGEIFASYGDTSNHFIGLSSTDSSKNSSFSIGFEDTNFDIGDNDFNDLIFTISSQT